MNLTNLADRVGKSNSYFFLVKKTNKELFDFYFSFNKNNLKSYYIALEKIENVRLLVQNIYLELEECKLKVQFSKYLKDKKVYQNKYSFLVVESDIYLSKRYVNYKTYLKHLQIIKFYEDFKKELITNSKK